MRRGSAGGVADEWVTQLLRQADAKVFKKYSQMKLRMKREAGENEPPSQRDAARIWHSDDPAKVFGTVLVLARCGQK